MDALESLYDYQTLWLSRHKVDSVATGRCQTLPFARNLAHNSAIKIAEE